MSDAKNLAPAGAVETDRVFTAAQSGRTVDGERFNHPANLRVTYSLPPSMTVQEVRQWYNAQLTDQGWTRSDSRSFEMTSDDGNGVASLQHEITIVEVGGSGSFDMTYYLEPYVAPPPD